ncbi:heparanase [Plakobranchus ocellatus]|uniref:Heparanase n=1 Tax=Plakobranchus ocellatus TaxID=259542 RepID=A0AAV4DDJ3_9GAST|nr:heparanase [Plakobranchus ocellatus]
MAVVIINTVDQNVVKQDLVLSDPNEKIEQRSGASQRIVIDTSTSLHITSSHYLSIAIDSGTIRWKFRGFDFSSKKLQDLAKALSPIYIRYGGNYADFLHFDPDGTESALPKHWDQEKQDLDQTFDSGFFDLPFDKEVANFTMTGRQWDNITRFCDKVGWDIMFDFNLFYWRNGFWDPTNADLLLRYSAARGVKIPSFQLGNEPNGFSRNYNLSIEGDILVQDFMILKNLISKYPQYDASGLYGPDVTTLDFHGSARTYLQNFLRAGGCDAVTEISVHHYYKNGRAAKVKDFLNPGVLDSLLTNLDFLLNITMEVCKFHKPFRLTETSSCYGGGAPKLSDAYVAGFMWLDKLGLSAKYKATHVFRQSFFGGSYALVNAKLNPNPDYFLSLLYKRLIEGPVFNVTTAEPNRLLRLYAHCARKGFYNYPDGALVLYYLNLANQSITFDFAQYGNDAVDVFLLTPGDAMDLTSRFVKLNGQPLVMKDSKVPDMPPKHETGDVTVAAESFGFIVIPSADIELCKRYHRS